MIVICVERYIQASVHVDRGRDCAVVVVVHQVQRRFVMCILSAVMGDATYIHILGGVGRHII